MAPAANGRDGGAGEEPAEPPASAPRDRAEGGDADLADLADLAEPDDPTDASCRRITIDGIALDRRQDDAAVSVEVRLHHTAAAGRAAGSIVLPDTLRLVASATTDAVGTLIGDQRRFVVERVEEVPIGGQSAVLVLVHRRDESRTLLGACLLRNLWIHEAVVRATLDALNRQLTAV